MHKAIDSMKYGHVVQLFLLAGLLATFYSSDLSRKLSTPCLVVVGVLCRHCCLTLALHFSTKSGCPRKVMLCVCIREYGVVRIPVIPFDATPLHQANFRCEDGACFHSELCNRLQATALVTVIHG